MKPTAKKEIGHVRPLPLTKEEKVQQVSIYLAQKKEQLFQGCLYSILSNSAFFPTSPELAVQRADELAELALVKLYPNLKTEE